MNDTVQNNRDADNEVMSESDIEESFALEAQTLKKEERSLTSDGQVQTSRLKGSEKVGELSDEDTVSYHVPGVDSEFYESHHPTNDALNEGNSEFGDRVSKLSPEELERFLMSQGLESSIRETARLNEAIKKAVRAKTMAMLVTCLLSVLLVAMLTAFTYYPKRTYIATSDNTAICGVSAQYSPNITDTAITEFARQAVTDLYTIDYINYPNQVEATMTRYFSRQGRVDQVNAFQNSGILDTVGAQALTLRASVTNAPRIEEKGVNSDGSPYWIVRFPMVIDVYSGTREPKDSQHHLVTVRLRADNASAGNPTGLGVLSVSMVPTTRSS